jgi:hypothetical protein
MNMKKKTDKIMLAIAVTAMMVVFTACAGGPMVNKWGGELKVDNSGTNVKKAYQVLHEGMYVLEGTVRLEDGQLVDCDVEEINTMLVWGNFSLNRISKDEIINLIGEHNIQTGLFNGEGPAAPTQFAKYVQVGDVVFTANSDATGMITYSSGTTGEVVSYLKKSEDNVAWFFKEMRAGHYWLLKNDKNVFEKVDIVSFFKDVPGDSLEKGKSQNKQYSKQRADWLPEIYKLEAFFKRNGFIPGNFKQGPDKVWAIADTSTGVTLAEFEEYSGILYKAYNK